MTTTLPDLASLTDDQLAALCAVADEATIDAAVAEAERRDREQLRRERTGAYRAAAKARYDALKREWWAQYVEPEHAAAEAACTFLLSRLGEREGITQTLGLWRGSREWARKRASEELNNWWDDHPRTGWSEFLRQRSAMARVQRQDIEGEAMDADTGAPAAPAWEGSAHYQARAEQRQRDLAGIRGERRDAHTAQITPGAALARRDAGTVAATPPQIDGAALLSYVRAFITKYTYLTPAQADAVTLWIGHSHARDEAGYLAWAASPRLYALSSKPGSGKSTLLEHLGRLCPATFGLDTEPTEAGLVYTISREHATVLLDEGDVLFASGRRKSAVRAVINSGYTPNGTTLKIKNGKGERVRIYGALALAALDVVEKATGGTMEATLSRGVAMRMVQAPEGHEIPEMTRTDEMNAAKLKLVLEKWGTANRDEMAALDVDVPEGIRNRQAQIWKTLLRVGAFADLSHKRARNDPDSVPPGGSWYDRAWDACEALALAGADDDADRTAELMDELGDAFGEI